MRKGAFFAVIGLIVCSLNSRTSYAAAAPAISIQPADVTIIAPAPANFKVTASGSLPLRYLWQVSVNGGSSWANVVNGTGINSPNLTTAPTSLAFQGRKYRVLVSNSSGMLPSEAATLTVNAAPVITVQPIGKVVTAPAIATFQAAAKGFPIPTYQWQVSTNGGSTWANVTEGSGGTTSSYSLATTGVDNGKKFRVIAHNGIGADATSNVITLIVHTVPSISIQPSDTTVIAPATAHFDMTATGSPALAYQWQTSVDNGITWANVTGGTGFTTAHYTTVPTTMAFQGRKYRVVVNNAWGTIHSNAVILTVQQKPVITTQPANCTVTAPGIATFSVLATGFPTPTYQWQESINGGSTWAKVSTGVGGTTPTYSFPTTAIDNGKILRVIVHNGAGNDSISNTARLTVYSAPLITVQPLSTTVTMPTQASFTVGAIGYPTPSYQWQVSTDNGANWNTTGTGTGIYSTPSTNLTFQGYKYRAVVSNLLGSTTSDTAILSVNMAPVITLQPADMTAITGTMAIFQVSVQGYPTPSLQWQTSVDGGATWNDVSNETKTSYSFEASATDNGKSIRIVVHNGIGNDLISRSAILTVHYPAPIIYSNYDSTSGGIQVTWYPVDASQNTCTFERVTCDINGNEKGSWIPIGQVTRGQKSLIDMNVQEGFRYKYRGTSAGGAVSSITSQPTYPVVIPLLPPTGLQASSISNGIKVNWQNHSQAATRVLVYRDNTIVATLAPSINAYQDTNLPLGYYNYKVGASDGNNESDSNIAQGITQNPPNALKLSAIPVTSAGGNAADLRPAGSWIFCNAGNPMGIISNDDPWPAFFPNDACYWTSPYVLSDVLGMPHFVYKKAPDSNTQQQMIVHTWFDGSSWQQSEILSRKFTWTTGDAGYTFRLDQDGTPHFLVDHSTDAVPYGGSTSTLEYVHQVNGTWTAESMGSAGSPINVFSYHLWVDGNRHAHVLIGNWQHVQEYGWNQSGTWTSSTLPTGNVNAGWYDFLDGAWIDDNNAWAFYERYGSSMDAYYQLVALQKLNGIWQTPVVLGSRAFTGSSDIAASISLSQDGKKVAVVYKSSRGIRVFCNTDSNWSETLVAPCSTPILGQGFDASNKLHLLMQTPESNFVDYSE